MLIIQHRIQENPMVGQIFGVEIDLWPTPCGWVISHDPPELKELENHVLFANWIKADRDHVGLRPQYWLNVKGDGGGNNAAWLKKILTDVKIDKNSYCFDMGYPMERCLREAGVLCAVRVSEEERNIPFGAAWYDYWGTVWNSDGIEILSGMPVCYASPELHGHDDYVTNFWEQLKKHDESEKELSLCTKYAHEAHAFFNEPSIR